MSSHMGDYRRMVRVEQHLVYATPTTPLVYQQSDDLWRSPRGTVLRIQALALVAITLSFFLAVFGSCRRWSNRWIVQKGFSAVQVLSLSLGTYSIGLMQSSSVKSELYPIWAVSLLTLLGCVDPVTTYIGLDYKGPLLKVVFQLCLYCGYVLLMSASTISSVFGNVAIGVLSGITFIKGFHRSLALVLPSRTRKKLGEVDSAEPGALARDGGGLEVHLPVHRSVVVEGKKRNEWEGRTTMADIRDSFKSESMPEQLGVTDKDDMLTGTIEHVCLGYSLSHLLQRRFLGLDTDREERNRNGGGNSSKSLESLVQDSRRVEMTLKAVAVELAFLYDVFYTSNEFLHYYEAKTSSFWALASFIGICLVGVAAALPRTRASSYYHHPGRNSSSAYNTAGPGARTVFVVNTTTADLVVTLVILVSMAALQLVQLIGCWTSNWARVDFACKYAATQPRRHRKVLVTTFPTIGSTSESQRHPQSKEWIERFVENNREPQSWWWRWMKLKAFLLTRINWFDNKYLWQDKLGQYSVVAAKSRSEQGWMKWLLREPCLKLPIIHGVRIRYWIRDRLPGMLGLQYILEAFQELCATSGDTKGGDGVRLHKDVKTSIANFLGIKSRRIREWPSLFADKEGLADLLNYLPHTISMSDASLLEKEKEKSHAYVFTHRVMVWHIATWYCELAEQEENVGGEEGGGGGGSSRRENCRRVAIALSKYCAYLVVSAPELLPGPSEETKRAFDGAALHTGRVVSSARIGLAAIIRESSSVDYSERMEKMDAFWTGVHFGKRLRNETRSCRTDENRTADHWKVLDLVWVQTLLYAAPYGDAQMHMQQLSQGGEFITHLWALLYHIGIKDKWETK